MTDIAVPNTRRGRPVGVPAEQIEAIALRLWSERGFHAVSVADIAAEAGVTARTIFRRYPAKANMVWGPLSASAQILTRALKQTSAEASLLDRTRAAIVGMLRAGDTDPTARHRIHIIGRTPELQNSTSAPFEQWRQILYRFALAQPDVSELRAHVFAWAVQSTTLAGLIWWAGQEPGVAPWEAVDMAFTQLKC